MGFEVLAIWIFRDLSWEKKNEEQDTIFGERDEIETMIRGRRIRTKLKKIIEIRE